VPVASSYAPESMLTSTFLTPDPESEAVPDMTKVVELRIVPLDGDDIEMDGGAASFVVVALTVIETVAMLLSNSPSRALSVKLSGPS